MSRLRVMIPSFTAKSYGGESYFRSILPALSRRRDVEIVLLAPDARYASLCGASVRLETIRLPRVFRGPARVAWDQIFLPRLAARFSADVIFTATNSGVFFGRRPCVIAVRNMDSLTPQPRGTPAWLLAHYALRRAVSLASMRTATRVVAVSGFVRDKVISLGVPAERVEVVYHGIDDIPRPDMSSPRLGGFMASAGKFIRYMNMETMIRAFGRLRAAGYSGELRIAAGPLDGGYETEMLDLVKILGLEDRIRFLGYRPREEILAMMRDSDAFLFPSTLEACPFTLLEAMSQGAAIVATTAPPMPEFAADGALLVAPKDDAVFAVAALKAVADGDLRARARARADAFTWDAAVDRLVACWRAACAS